MNTVLNAAARRLVLARAALSPTEPVAAAIAACRAVARHEMGYARLSPTLAREVDALVLSVRGVHVSALAAPSAAVTTLRLSTEDRAAIVMAFLWFVRWATALLQTLAGRRDVALPAPPFANESAGDLRASSFAQTQSFAPYALPARLHDLNPRAPLALPGPVGQDAAIVVRSN